MRAWIRIGWVVVVALILITTAFAVHRVVVDSKSIREGIVPPVESFDRGYALHPTLAYLHILPGVIYMICGTLQFMARIRNKHILFHRRLGRVLVLCGLLAGLMAIVVGIVFPFGGFMETSATITFGIIFVFSIGKAFLQVRKGQIAAHREWMIRAYAIGLGVGTIRLLIPPLLSTTGRSFQEIFGLAFWIAFALHLLVAEIWIRSTRSVKV